MKCLLPLLMKFRKGPLVFNSAWEFWCNRCLHTLSEQIRFIIPKCKRNVAFQKRSEKEIQVKGSWVHWPEDTFAFCWSDCIRNLFKSVYIRGNFFPPTNIWSTKTQCRQVNLLPIIRKQFFGGKCSGMTQPTGSATSQLCDLGSHIAAIVLDLVLSPTWKIKEWE